MGGLPACGAPRRPRGSCYSFDHRFLEQVLCCFRVFCIGKFVEFYRVFVKERLARNVYRTFAGSRGWFSLLACERQANSQYGSSRRRGALSGSSMPTVSSSKPIERDRERPPKTRLKVATRRQRTRPLESWVPDRAQKMTRTTGR